MLEEYKENIKERLEFGIDPKPLSADQVSDLIQLLINPPGGEADLIKYLLVERVPPGVDEAAKIKAAFLSDIAFGKITSPLVGRKEAVFLLGTMIGGYNVKPLIELLDDADLGKEAARALSGLLLVFDYLDNIIKKSKENPLAREVLDAWAEAAWFKGKPEIPETIDLTVFKIDGEVNTDDLSPASEAWSRPDIPFHALSMLANRENNPIENIAELKKKGYPLVFVADVVGTGSSRKSATNSLLWHIGKDIPYVPNKRQGGFVIGGKIAPIFFNTLEDAGVLPIECDVAQLKSGDTIRIYPYEGKITDISSGRVLSEFTLKSDVLFDSVRAGGRIPLIIGRNLTGKTRNALHLPETNIFRKPANRENKKNGFSLAQKMVGKACGLKGVHPGMYCEPEITTVGSQDTTGPMTRDELKELGCMAFSADLVMQSFCHTAAYPKPIDVKRFHTLPGFITQRGGIALEPGDGVIHPWLNRMALPDTVGTGGDSHTRFPIGISFPAGSGLVAFGAAMGMIPLDMPESVLVRFKGDIQPGITQRDLVNAIPYVAIQKGLLTVEKEGKKNIFSGRILEMEGLEDLTVDQAFEFTDASAERSAAASTFQLKKESVSAFIKSNIALLEKMIQNGYADSDTISNRIKEMQSFLDAPDLLKADPDAEYAAVIDIDLNSVKEPVLACPNDPDDVRLLSEVAGTSVDEVFIGSCMTNITHYRAASKLFENNTEINVRLWIAPATKMDAHRLREEGHYSIFGKVGARMELPGCSLCMGNQARVKDNAVVVSTSTRNFPERMGTNSRVFLASTELSAICAILGRIPNPDEYRQFMGSIEKDASEIYRFLDFSNKDI